MKHNKIFSSEVVHKGKTLDKVLESSGGDSDNKKPDPFVISAIYKKNSNHLTAVGSTQDLFDIGNNLLEYFKTYGNDAPVELQVYPSSTDDALGMTTTQYIKFRAIFISKSFDNTNDVLQSYFLASIPVVSSDLSQYANRMSTDTMNLPIITKVCTVCLNSDI